MEMLPDTLNLQVLVKDGWMQEIYPYYFVENMQILDTSTENVMACIIIVEGFCRL